VTKLQRGAKIAVTMSTASGASKIWPAYHAKVNGERWRICDDIGPAWLWKQDELRAYTQGYCAGMIGNALEWYDFAIYGYFAVQIGRHFFPHDDAVAQLLSTFGIFAIGYLMRPIGGVLVGHIGDRFGRRTALIFSVTAMAIPTFLIGLLPAYQTIGVLAPIGLTLLRVVQGLSVGGEYPSSMVFLVEHAPEGRRGLMGAFAATGSAILANGSGFWSLAGAAAYNSARRRLAQSSSVMPHPWLSRVGRAPLPAGR